MSIPIPGQTTHDSEGPRVDLTQAVAEARLLAAVVGDLSDAVLHSDHQRSVILIQQARESSAFLLWALGEVR